MLLKAILCFDTQSYPNKELVISYPHDDLATKAIIDQIKDIPELKIMAIERSNEISLGNARNEAVAQCNGEYICTWDDDDWYDRLRLAEQFNGLRATGRFCKASVLSGIMIYDSKNYAAYRSFSYRWAGTLLCKKELVLAHPYHDDDKIEDRDLMEFLTAKKLLLHIEGYFFLYIYIFHGYNVIDELHFNYFIKRSYLLDQKSLEWVKSVSELNVTLS